MTTISGPKDNLSARLASSEKLAEELDKARRGVQGVGAKENSHSDTSITDVRHSGGLTESRGAPKGKPINLSPSSPKFDED